MDLINSTVASRFRIEKKIGKGSFGQVFQARDLTSQAEVAVKVESAVGVRQLLLYEAKILRNLSAIPCVPRVHWSGMEGSYSFLVMDLLGPSLSKKFELCGKKLSLKDWVSIGLQLVQRLEDVHSCCYLHRDIKPENFALGRKCGESQLFVLDFGLAKKFREPKSLQHIPYCENKTLTGTARYASIHTHLGLEQSRRDDLESLLYLMVFLAKGELPWQGITARSRAEKYTKIAERKSATRPEELCGELPLEMTEMVKYVRSLRFEETPDYDFLLERFMRIAETGKVRTDGRLDWNSPLSLHPPVKSARKSRRGHRRSVLSSGSGAVSDSSHCEASEDTHICRLPIISPAVRHAARPSTKSSSLLTEEKTCALW